METSEFEIYLKKIPFLMKHFIGVFPIDKLPTNLKKKQFFVANTDPSYKNGSHWVAFIRLDTIECEVFDSLAQNLESFLPFFNFQQKLKFTYNSTPVQSITSKLCGKFVITFLIERMLNQTMEFEDLLESIFSSDLNENDSIVTNFCKSL